MVVCGACEKIRNPINKIISGKVLPASQFASITLYWSEQASQKRHKHKLKFINFK